MPWLHGLSALAAFGLAALAMGGDGFARTALVHPLVLIPATIFALSIVLLPFTTLPMLSLLGAPEHGFGALAYLDLAVLTAAAFVTLSDSVWRRVAVAACFAAIAGAFALDAAFRSSATWAPFFFGDYLAFYAVFAFAILGTLTAGRRILFALVILLCLVLAMLSSNRAAFLAVGGALVLLPVYWRYRMAGPAIALAIAGPVAVGLLIVLVGSTFNEGYREVLQRTSGFGPLPNLIADSWASLWSRAMLVVVGAQSLMDEPWRFLVGLGWGHYNEALLANLPLVEGRLHELIGPSKVYWDAIRRSDFHSHNQYFEALLSTGFVGASLLVAYGVTIVAYAPAKRRTLAITVMLLLVVLQSFWFQMPHTLPVMAMAVVCMTDRRAGDLAPRLPTVWSVGGAAFAAAVLGVVAVIAGSIASNMASERNAIDRVTNGDAGPSFERCPAYGLRELYDATLIQRAFAQAQKGADPATLAVLEVYLSAAVDGHRTKSLKLAISLANTRSGVAFARPEFQEALSFQDDVYGASIEGVIRKAPRRSDIAIPYFNYLLAAGREAKALELANLILVRQEEDPVALWFSGIVLLGRENTSLAGIRNLRRSLERGIQSLMPVDDDLRRQIEQ